MSCVLHDQQYALFATEITDVKSGNFQNVRALTNLHPKNWFKGFAYHMKQGSINDSSSVVQRITIYSGNLYIYQLRGWAEYPLAHATPTWVNII